MSGGFRVAVLGLRPGPGGIGRVMVNLFTGMIRCGVELDLLLPFGDYPELEASNLALPMFRLDGEDPERALGQLVRYLTDRKPNALLSNKDQTNALLARMPRGAGHPFTVFRVGTHIPAKLRRSAPLTAWLKRRRLAAAYRRADALIGISRGVGEALVQMTGPGGPPVYTIWNPVDLDNIRLQAAQAPDHPWLADKEGPVIVSVGRLVAAKDFGTLLRAFARMRRSLKCRLIVLGEGGQRRRLTALADSLGVAADFDLPGFRSNPFALMGRADLFVISSIFEGANNALMEALALGTPCVATDCPSGPREILDDGRLGRLVKVGDVDGLADAMQAAMESSPDRELLRQAAQRFDLNASVGRYLAILQGGTGLPP